MRIARLTDRFKINLQGVVVTITPLSGRQKLEMTSMIKQGHDGKLYLDKSSQEHYLIKHSIKAIEGLKDHDENDYQLEFDGDSLSDNCAEELLGFLVNTFFSVANTQVLSGVFGEVINPINGKIIEGINIERIKDSEKKAD